MFRADASKRHEGANRPAQKMNSRCDFVRAAHAGSELKLVCMSMFSERYIIVVAGGQVFRAISAKLFAIDMAINDWVLQFRDANRDVCVGGRKCLAIVHIFRADASKRHEGANRPAQKMNSRCDFVRAAHAGSELKLVCMSMFSERYIIVVAGGRNCCVNEIKFRAFARFRSTSARRIRGFVCACCVNEVKVCVSGRKSFSTVQMFRADASKRHEGAKKIRVFARFRCASARKIREIEN